MKKQAYTLAETLVTLAVIGIIAALTLPLINKLKPDETKVNYLKAYDALSTSVRTLGSMSSVYGVVQDFDGNAVKANIQRFPFLSQGQAKNTNFTGPSKFCKLIAQSMGINEADSHCSDTTLQNSPYTEEMWNNADNYFQTQNGMQWIIRQNIPVPAAGTISGDGKHYTIDNVINHVYVKYKNQIFHFGVGADGTIAAMDDDGARYLATRRSWLRTNSEQNAENLSATITLPIASSPMVDCIGQGWIWDNQTGTCTQPAQPGGGGEQPGGGGEQPGGGGNDEGANSQYFCLGSDWSISDMDLRYTQSGMPSDWWDWSDVYIDIPAGLIVSRNFLNPAMSTKEQLEPLRNLFLHSNEVNAKGQAVEYISGYDKKDIQFSSWLPEEGHTMYTGEFYPCDKNGNRTSDKNYTLNPQDYSYSGSSSSSGTTLQIQTGGSTHHGGGGHQHTHSTLDGSTNHSSQQIHSNK